MPPLRIKPRRFFATESEMKHERVMAKFLISLVRTDKRRLRMMAQQVVDKHNLLPLITRETTATTNE